MSATRLPIIGLTADLGETAARPGRPSLPRYELKQAYCDAVLAAGALPLILPYVGGPQAGASPIDALLDLCDGLVVTGGAFDIPPALYGEEAQAQLGPQKPSRTSFEQRLMRGALARQLPLLGVCGGMQLLAVELGGTLFQDLRTDLPDGVPGAAALLEHEQAHDSREPAHAVLVEEGSLLHRVTSARELRVNTTHHQAVRSPGRAHVSGRAPDGVIEAIELQPAGEGGAPFVLGVEWHPELLDDEESRSIYRALATAAAKRKAGR